MSFSMLHLKYIGDRPELKDCEALLQYKGGDFVQAQFDHCDGAQELMYNWHQFLASDFMGDLRLQKANFGMARGEWYSVYNADTEFYSPRFELGTCYEILENCMKGQLPSWAPRNFIEKTHGIFA